MIKRCNYFSENLRESLADVSMLKFAPCSGNALCLKLQVNPSITVYPLDDCNDAGINYIEFNKYPEGSDISGSVSRWVDDHLGKVQPQNYTQQVHAMMGRKGPLPAYNSEYIKYILNNY